MGSAVQYEVDGAIAAITLDDGKANALSPDVLGALAEAFRRAEGEGRGVVLAGRPGTFSAGFDLSVLGAMGDDAVAMLRAGFELSHQVLSHPLPVVAACTGHALAMGLFLLLSADHRIGVEGAAHRLAANEVAIGLTMPRSALEIQRQRIAPTHQTRVAVLGETFAPDAAVAAGFLDEVVPHDELLAAAHARATACMDLDLAAVAGTKARLRAPVLAALAEAIELDDADHRALAA